MKKQILLLLLIASTAGWAQIQGRVTDSKNKPLSFVSVYLDGTVTGTTTNDSGTYILPIKSEGKYTVIFQFLGYKTQKKQVNVTSFPFELNVKLANEEVVLDEVVVSSEENPANQIIRNTIANKTKNTQKQEKFTADYYSKGLIRIKNAPKSILGAEIGDFGGGLDSTRTGIIYLSETVSKISSKKNPNRFKEKIIASKISGRDNGISFNRAKEVDFNFYENNVTIGNSELISPISNSAFGYYRYKLKGTFYTEDGKLINKVQLLPRRETDRVFSGFIYIIEDDWALYGVDVVTTGERINIVAVDTLNLKQNYNFSKSNNAWVLATQTIDFKAGMFGINLNGRFSAAFSNHNFSPVFNENTFGNMVLSFEKNATKKDSVYWNKLRPVPLTLEENEDYIKRDSIKEIRKSKKYLDSVDVAKNKFSVGDILGGYTYKNSYKKWQVDVSSPLRSIRFNTVQGWNSSVNVDFTKFDRPFVRKWNVGANFNYGLSDKKLRPTVNGYYIFNYFSRPILSFSGGITTQQFNNREPITPLFNTISSLFWERNYLKIYEKTFARASYSNEVFNGFRLYTSLEFADRKPLFNTTDYSVINRENVNYSANNPQLFNPHQIWTAEVGARIVFGQKYLMYPNQKFNLYSNKYPRLSLAYRKTFGSGNSQNHSDMFLARLRQNFSVGNMGNFEYNIRSGIFLEKKDIPLMDYLQPNGNLLKLAPNRPINRFNLLPYYQFASNDKYSEMHAEHNFQGFLLGKIPLLNKLNFHLVAGAKGLFTADRKPYTEYSVGLDNIGWGKWRFLRVDYVRSNYNGQSNNGFVFGISLLN